MSGKRVKRLLVREWSLRLLVTFGIFFFLPRLAYPFCHEIELNRNGSLWRTVAARESGPVTVEWLGHSAFLLTSSKGTKVLMDPHGRTFPPPAVFPDVVTTSHLHGNHSFIWMASGNPRVLYGLNLNDGNWNPIHTVIRDVSIYTVPSYHDSEMGLARGNNSIFVVRMDNICVAHLGDLGHLLSESQIKMLGKIDVLLVPLGQGGFRITSEDAAKVIGQVKPKLAIPHHYSWEGYVEEFAELFPRVRNVEANKIKLVKERLNFNLEIVVLKDTSERYSD